MQGRGTESGQGDREPSTEILCTSSEKRRAEEKSVRGNSLEPGLLGTENAKSLHSGCGRLLPNKMPVLVAEKKPFTEQEKNREIEVTYEMEKEINWDWV